MSSAKSDPASGAGEALRPASGARWFAEEVHPHEASLRAYLHGSFPAVRDVDDVVQESFLRIWRARAIEPVRSARAFLFRVARNLALDLVRRDQASPVIAVRDWEGLSVLDHDGDPARAVDERVKLLALVDAIEALPPRCREVVILRKLQQIPQREVARQLGLAEKTVEAHLARGLARCEEFLLRRGIRGWYQHD
jgi:RNA polymerase sigma factor (sigma-70 family)